MAKSVLYLKRTYIVMRKVLDDRLSEYNLTTSQFEVMGYLYKSNGLEQQQLQYCSGITSATMTGILDKLETRGFILRKPSMSDGRAKMVVLTDEGRDILSQIIDVLHEFENVMLKGFSPAERALLTDWLQRIANNLGATESGDCT